MSEPLNTIKEAVVNRKRKEIEGLVGDAIEAGIGPRHDYQQRSD